MEGLQFFLLNLEHRFNNFSVGPLFFFDVLFIFRNRRAWIVVGHTEFAIGTVNGVEAIQGLKDSRLSCLVLPHETGFVPNLERIRIEDGPEFSNLSFL